MRGAAKAAARAATGQAAAAREGIKAEYANRIDAAYRSGATKEQIAAIVRGIKQEMQASLRAAAELAATDLTGRVSEAISAQRGKGKTKGGKVPHGPKHH